MSVHEDTGRLAMAAAAEPAAPDDHHCVHCGAPLMRVVTSYQHNRVDAVCSVGWNAPYAPDALPCGATRLDTETRFVLTELGRRALLTARLCEPGPSVAEVEARARARVAA
jgi:hypothetical protein